MNLNDIKDQLTETIRYYNSKGWSPATSTNYSFRYFDKLSRTKENGTIWVSRSGIDKSQFHANDFITVDSNGNAIGEYATCKPSAETLIHCVLYDMFPKINVILHSHSVYPILLSLVEDDRVAFQGYEIQKGFDGETKHENVVNIPIFKNTQEMLEFANTLRENKDKLNHHSFIIEKHGTYAWGKDLFEAKRHLETLDYLCQCKWMLRIK